ncbi:MAG TPA: hypothetical protein PLX89_12460 [Verrucomicrobiota bacterium]|nr:hypothetical protein [Verrucomicrobiales bacterium]HRI13805.1 hypothetical protein [Verrucomicrobiota bacterium]
MIIPQYWAEGRAQHRQKGRQITVRRFGWSEISQSEAQANADVRALEALQRLLSGETLARREPKTPYNGAIGVPIREEIVSCHGDTIITRNSYGARCLNTPNVFFADIDFRLQPTFTFTFSAFIVLLLLASAIAWLAGSLTLGIILVALVLLFTKIAADTVYRTVKRAKGGAELAAKTRVREFLARHPEWNLRVYRTPAGLRLMATHRTFSPNEPEVIECFDALGADPVYAAMCLNQHCFRARVSPKPWRIGINSHLKPRPGVWPVAPERIRSRNDWIAKYEAAAQSFAACSLQETLGSGIMHHDVRPVQQLHDEQCGAVSQRPIA